MKKYYTDWHNVDEDLRTIARCGGRWYEGSNAGITLRSVSDVPTTVFGDVASSDIRN